jgi:Cys-tRNA(Pro)/Cys-tRNA(Cys) deacylase
VWHRVYEYTHDRDETSFGSEAVKKLGVDPGRLYKTLVVETHDGQLANALVAAADMLNFRQMARALDVKSVRLADATKAQRKTGYVLGGIAPVGQKTALPTVIDTTVDTHETVWVSAGRRGLSVELKVTDLLNLSRGIVAPIRR